jgi:hypothetical protein
MSVHNIDIDLLAPIIFLKNPNNLPILLDITRDPLKNTKDIFYFCADIFFKGLFYLHHTADNKVIINNLSIEQIYEVISKLRNAKIMTSIKIIEKEVDQTQAHTIINDSLKRVKDLQDHENLNTYDLRIPLNGVLYSISFGLIS